MTWHVSQTTPVGRLSPNLTPTLTDAYLSTPSETWGDSTTTARTNDNVKSDVVWFVCRHRTIPGEQGVVSFITVSRSFRWTKSTGAVNPVSFVGGLVWLPALQNRISCFFFCFLLSTLTRIKHFVARSRTRGVWKSTPACWMPVSKVDEIPY